LIVGTNPVEFTPAVYEHAAALIGMSPWSVSRTEDLMVEAPTRAYQTYRHSPVVVGIDIYNLEAEAYGARISPPDGNNIPAVTGYVCASAGDIPGLCLPDPLTDGRLPLALNAAQRLTQTFPDADIRVPVSGPFSIAANLVGLDTLLCEVLTEPGMVLSALLHIVRGQRRFFESIRNSGLRPMSFESAATPPLLSPRLFRAVVLPALTQFVRNAHDVFAAPVPCIIGGNTTPIVDALMETGTQDVICPSETDQTAFMNVMSSYPDVTVRINMNPGVFSAAPWPDVERELLRVLALAEKRPRTCIGTGVLPFEAEPAVVLRAQEYVRSTSTPRIHSHRNNS
jgi:uroporphyrinogen decarboxylase